MQYTQVSTARTGLELNVTGNFIRGTQKVDICGVDDRGINDLLLSPELRPYYDRKDERSGGVEPRLSD